MCTHVCTCAPTCAVHRVLTCGMCTEDVHTPGHLDLSVCLGALGTALPAPDSTRGLSPIHRHPPSVSPVPSAPQGRPRSQKCPTQTWSATRIVIGASRTLLSLSKYFPASSGRERLKETGGT